MTKTRYCPECRAQRPVEPDDDTLNYRNHARGINKGACRLSGKPVNPEDRDPPSTEPTSTGPREGHGKPPETHE